MLNTVDSSVFLNSKYINMKPVVSAEWNNNLYNSPYVVVSGNAAFNPSDISYYGSLSTKTLSSVSSGSEYAKENFVTNSFPLDAGASTSTVAFRYSGTLAAGEAYKIVMYVKTNSIYPVLLNTNIAGYSAKSKEIDSLNWTKIETYASWDSNVTPTSLDFIINASNIVTYNTSANIYITLPEVYKITRFDYENGSLWSAYSPFKIFRPGESYVSSGNADISYPVNFRRATKGLKSGQTYQDMPISPLVNNPKFFLASPPVGIYKTGVANDTMPYQYFVSSDQSAEKIITAKYEKTVYCNKLVLKFNTLMSTPTVTVSLDGSSIGSFTPDSTGLLVLYYSGSSWSTTKWASSITPRFSKTGTMSPAYKEFNKISINQISSSVSSSFSSYSSLTSEMTRLQLIEVSPRLEIDLTDLVLNVSINKSLDSKNSYVPISSINSNDASIEISAIPLTSSTGPIPLFSNESNLTNTVLKNMLTKNVKFYISFLLSEASSPAISTQDYYIPAGVFYSESWSESDVSSVSVQAYDITRYLQTTPVPDYVANKKSVFDIISNILDLSGFTDYDYDSLYNVCNDPVLPLDLAYYYCNSKDSTIVEALSEIFLAYQIGAYIDEYGIMKFLSLSNIMSNTGTTISISDSNIIDGGYSIQTNAKPGKISLRYQPPKIKQSLSLQNTASPDMKNSPSFIYATSNDVVWSQQNLDSVGFNYLSKSMSANSNSFTLDKRDLLDIFHTYSLNSNGYAAIENEIVSFVYKEYNIKTHDYVEGVSGHQETVSVKSDIELAYEINRFIRKYPITIRKIDSVITDVIGTGDLVSYVSDNDFVIGDSVSIVGVTPAVYNIIGTIVDRDPTYFSIKNTAVGTFNSAASLNAMAIAKTDYDVTIEPTGNINNVQRGVFNTKVSEHNILETTIESKGLTQARVSSSNVISTGNIDATVLSESSYPDIDKNSYSKIAVRSSTLIDKVLIYSDTDRDSGNQLDTITEKYLGYQTYMTKFNFNYDVKLGSAGLFFNLDSDLTMTNSYFVEITQYYKSTKTTLDGYGNPTKVYGYLCTVYYINSSNEKIIVGYSDISSIVASIVFNFPKVMTKTTDSYTGIVSYKNDLTVETPFILKVAHSIEENVLGNVATDGDRVLRVFLNNIEISGWQVPINGSSVAITGATVDYEFHKTTYSFSGTKPSDFIAGNSVTISGINPTELNGTFVIYATTSSSFTINQIVSSSAYISDGTAVIVDTINETSYKTIDVNSTSKIRKKLVLPHQISENTIFGIFASANPLMDNGVTADNLNICTFSEIYATQSDLKEHSVNYFFQDRRFLNASLQGQNLMEKTYCMQTKPEVIGINYYDVQYTTPAAVSVDVLPIEYSWYYFPGNMPEDQKWYQRQFVSETSVSYSTPINTGFRAKMIIVNNAPHMVFLNKESDELNQFTVRLNLWTHEIIAQSDQEIIEKSVSDSNSSEVAQIDSEWIQSKQAANRMLSTINSGLDGFSKNTTIQIFGNPLIQVGDVVSLTYTLNGINQQKYTVHSVNHSFDNGLSTTLVLNTIKKGISYSV
jgi:hypothetical protein